MSIVKITDSVGATADFEIRDDSPLAKAELTQLSLNTKAIVASFSQPVDQTEMDRVSVGARFTSPSLIDGIPTLKIDAGINSDLEVITSKDKTLFPDDGFSPVIAILDKQCWVGFGIDASLEADLTASENGFGVAVYSSTKLSLSSYVMFHAIPLPSLKDAIGHTIEKYSVSCSSFLLRTQEPGTVNVSEVSGSVQVKGSYSFPFTLNSFASANLPFNFKINVAPTATAKISGSVTIQGDFLVRSHKLAPQTLRLGVYKKRASTFVVSIDADAGLAVQAGDTDLLGTVLNAVLPGTKAQDAGILPDTAKALNAVIKAGLDRSLAIELNVTCSAANTHEAAILYEIDLSKNAEETDVALTAALKGDWTLIGLLPNAQSLRNIIVDTKERKRLLSFNLLGVYSAVSLNDYLAKCTILRDDTGQLTIVDKVEASRISASTFPYAADSEKLRTALAQDFLATATYAAIGSHLNLSLSVGQTYFEYDNDMSKQQMRNNVLLGVCLNVIPPNLFGGIFDAVSSFPHARVRVSVTYDATAAMSLFFSNPAQRVPRTAPDLEQTGRDTMILLIDPTDPSNTERLNVLKSDSVWSRMDETGDLSGIGSIPYIEHLNATERDAVETDWVSVTWWRNSMLHVAPALANVFNSIEAIGLADPTKDAKFMSMKSKLADILGSIARDTKAAFVDGWGPAVMFALSGRHGVVDMEIAWDGNDQRFETK